MKADARVQFPQERAPRSEGVARTVVTVADSIARGDHEALRQLLDRPSQGVLDELVAAGDWTSSTAKIEAVRVVRMDEQLDAANISLAVQDPRGAYVLNWAVQGTGPYVLAARPSSGAEFPRAIDWDGKDTQPVTEATVKEEKKAEGEEVEKSRPSHGDEVEEDSPPPVKPRDPNRKNTPGGPVDIPKPGGGGGGG